MLMSVIVDIPKFKPFVYLFMMLQEVAKSGSPMVYGCYGSMSPGPKLGIHVIYNRNIYICACIYIHMYITIHMHAYMCMYVYMHKCTTNLQITLVTVIKHSIYPPFNCSLDPRYSLLLVHGLGACSPAPVAGILILLTA